MYKIDYQFIYSSQMPANGPAIKGGCVTRRWHRAASWYFSRKTVTAQGGYGARFCSPDTMLVELYVCRGTRLVASQLFIPGYKVGGGHWRSVAVQTISKPEICQGTGI